MSSLTGFPPSMLRGSGGGHHHTGKMSRHSSSYAKARESLIVLAVSVVATYPMFVESFRLMMFQAAPRDDYAPYLLHILGRGGEVPGAPFAYRFMSVAIAAPFYSLLPAYRFTNLVNVDLAYLKATQALAFVSWMSLAMLAVVIYRTARDRLGASPGASIAALFATALFSRYTAVAGVDPLAMLFIAVAAYAFERPPAFAVVTVLSTAFNEKIWIVLTVLVAARAVDARALRPYRTHLIACVVAICSYAAAKLYFHVPGSEHQTAPSMFASNAVEALRLTLSAKGMIQNVFPITLVFGTFAWASRRLKGSVRPFFTTWDTLVPAALMALGIAINVAFNLGRLVMHSLPLIMPALAVALDRVRIEAADPVQREHGRAA